MSDDGERSGARRGRERADSRELDPIDDDDHETLDEYDEELGEPTPRFSDAASAIAKRIDLVNAIMHCREFC